MDNKNIDISVNRTLYPSHRLLMIDCSFDIDIPPDSRLSDVICSPAIRQDLHVVSVTFVSTYTRP